MEKKKTKRIKVISVVTRIAMDSAGKQAILITDGLNRDLYDTLLVTGTCEDNEVDMTRWAKEKDIRHVIIPEMKREIRLHLDFIAFVKLFIMFVRERPDVVHTRTAKAGCLGRIAARLAFVPVVIHTFDGHVFNGYFGKHKTALILWVERFLARITDRIIAISNSQKTELMHYLRINNPEKIHVAHIGFDFREFKPLGNGELRRELNCSDDDLLVGYIGRFAPIKRIDRLILAFQKVIERIPKAKLVIAGGGELKSEMEEMVSSLNLQDKIFFLGVQDDVEKIYSGVNMVALSSDNEGTPAVLIEALAYGKPVVSTCVGGIPDVVSNGESGILAKANGPDELADSIIQMLSDADMRNKMGRMGMQEVRRKFSLENLIENLDKIYINELSHRSRRFRRQFAEFLSSR